MSKADIVFGGPFPCPDCGRMTRAVAGEKCICKFEEKQLPDDLAKILKDKFSNLLTTPPEEQ